MSNAFHTLHSRAPSASWSAPSAGRWFVSVSNAIGSAFRWWLKGREQARAIRHLRKLDDRMLKDMGLHRSQITSAVTTGRVGADR